MAHAERDSFSGLRFSKARKAVYSGTATRDELRIYEMHKIGHQTARVLESNGGKKKTAAAKLDEVHEIGNCGWRCRSCRKMNKDGKAGEVKCFHCNSKFKFVPSK